MENLIYHNSTPLNFIRVLFKIFFAFFLIAILLLIFLRINDRITFTEGEVYSTNPQVKITAPSETRVIKTFISEGQQIQKNDTLFILENKKIASEYKAALQEVATLERKMQVIKSMLENTLNRKKALRDLAAIQSQIYSADTNKSRRDAEAIAAKLNVLQEQKKILVEKQISDSLLYNKGAISKFEAMETKNKALDFNRQQIETYSSLEQKKYDHENLQNNYQKSDNSIQMALIDADNQAENYRREIITLQSEMKNKSYNLNYLFDEASRMIVLAPENGTISNLYNTKQNSEFLNKGELLAIVAPASEEFYVKITMPEKELAYIKTGQEVNLKLDAYYYYRFGIVKGVIEYISPSDINKAFFATVRLKSFNKNIQLRAGYKLKGEIIIEKMRAYKYVFKKLFNKVGGTA